MKVDTTLTKRFDSMSNDTNVTNIKKKLIPHFMTNIQSLQNNIILGQTKYFWKIK